MAMKVGIQLYSVRNHMAQDPVDTIRRVAEAGYRYLEVANFKADTDPGVGFGVSLEELRKILDDTGAQVFSAHLAPLDPDNMTHLLDFHQAIGTKFFVHPMDFYTGRDDALRKAEYMNKLGEKCKPYGIELLYHNHYHEFQRFGDETVYDILMNNTDPELVKIEVDTFWASRGKQDPIEFLKKYGKRVRLIHQKDFAHGYESELDLLTSVEEEGNEPITRERFGRDAHREAFTEIGTGIMNIQGIIDTANTCCSCDYIVLEQDHSQHDELESIAISMESFHKFNGVEW